MRGESVSTRLSRALSSTVPAQAQSRPFIHFRCHTGPTFSIRSFLTALTESIKDVVWNTLRALDQSVLLMRHRAQHLQHRALSNPLMCGNTPSTIDVEPNGCSHR
jgi:hypothetical protein